MNHVGGLCTSLKRNSLTPRDRKKFSSALSERVFKWVSSGPFDPTVRFAHAGGDLPGSGARFRYCRSPRGAMASEGTALFCAIRQP